MDREGKTPDLVKEVRELTDLFEIAKTVVSTLDLDKVLSSILKSAMDIVQTPSGSIALYNQEKNEMTIHAAMGFSEEFLSHKSWKVNKGGLTERILNNEYPLVIDDTGRKHFFNNPVARDEGIKSLVAAPLIFHGKVVGILYVDDFRSRRFEENTLRLLSILTSFAAMSIDNARLHEETFKLAITDGLTGLYNHRYFQEVLEDEIARSKRYNLYASLIFIDIDDFKKFNDKFGHQLGDKVLKEVANSITRTIREVDCAARYGGEEFSIILPEIDIDSAHVVAERIRKNVMTDTEAFLAEYKMKITVTIGVASYPFDALDKDELIKKSDLALYYGKRHGKNHAIRYDKIAKAVDTDKNDNETVQKTKN